MLSGGWDELFGGSGPKASDPEVVAAVTHGGEENEQELAALVDGYVRRSLGPGTAVVARARGQPCDPGQHNFKRDDPYHLFCTVSDAVIVTGATAAFKDDMLRLARSLAADPTWAGEQTWPVTRVISEYWSPRSADGYFAPSNLPDARYDDGSAHHLHIGWVDRFDLGLGLPSMDATPQWRTADGEPVDSAVLLERLPAWDGYAMVLEVERTAFEE
jgi:hypothetical protein